MTTNTGGPAFSRDHAHDGHNGMTLRDYFAGLAMQTLAANRDWSEEGIARAAYWQADAMLSAREVKA